MTSSRIALAGPLVSPAPGLGCAPPSMRWAQDRLRDWVAETVNSLNAAMQATGTTLSGTEPCRGAALVVVMGQVV
eukprot:Skav216261  [mRNA]  locus=scaffold20:798789:799013:- [translate_table: standard]